MNRRQYLYTLLVICFLATGCARPQNQGNMVRDGEVDRLVESATVLPGHTYFYTGPEAQPDAIIAIENSFTLNSKYWIQVDDVEEKLNSWNTVIDNPHRINYAYEGARIMTPEDREVGIWYSPYNYSFVQFPDTSTILIYTPTTTQGVRGGPVGRFGGRN